MRWRFQYESEIACSKSREKGRSATLTDLPEKEEKQLRLLF